MPRLPANRAEWAELADVSWRAATPALLVVPLLGLMALPLPLPVQPAMPQLGLLAIMSWSVRKPEWMPPLAAIGLGLLQDLWQGSPLGQSGLLFGFVAALLGQQAVFFLSRPFRTEWGICAGVAVLCQLLIWGSDSLMADRALPVWGLLLQTVLTCALAPVIALATNHVLTRLLDRQTGELL